MLIQISDVAVTDALKHNAVVVTHTVVPEKYRITDDNKKGILKSPVDITMGPLGNVFISDVGTGKILKVRASHYPASVAVEVDSLDCLVGIALNKGILFIAESASHADNGGIYVVNFLDLRKLYAMGTNAMGRGYVVS